MRTSAVLVCTLYLLLHTATLVATILFMNQPDQILAKVLELVDTEDSRLENSYTFQLIRPYIVENSGEYFALPITVLLVLILSNILAAWGALFSHALLLLPWIALYFLILILAAGLLIYVIIVLEDIWFQVILFLVVAPLIVIGVAFWLVFVRLYRTTRHTRRKDVSQSRSLPPTMYTPEPHSWDQPLPIWAVNPPKNAWDPYFLQQIDPRYMTTPEPSTRASRSSRTRSFRSRSRSDRSFRESDVSHDSSREAGYHQTGSVCLSDKYGGRYEDMSDRERSDEQEHSEYQTDGHSEYQTDRHSEYQTDGQSEFQSENDEQQALSDVTEDTGESGEESPEHFEHEVELVAEDDAHYAIQRIPRPKSRSDISN